METVGELGTRPLGHPTTHGLYDPLMGPWSFQAGLCTTCLLNVDHCPGHYGHIDLPLPVFHPMFQRNVIKILKLTCPCCKKFFFTRTSKALLTGQLELLRYGLLTQAHQLTDRMHSEEDENEDVDDTIKYSTKTQRKTLDEEEAVREIEAQVEKYKEEAGELLEEDCSSRHVENLRLLLTKTFYHRQSAGTKCVTCSGGWKSIVFYKSRIVYTLKPGTVSTAVGGHSMKDPGILPDENEEENVSSVSKTKKRQSVNAMPTMYLMASDAREHFREVWKNDQSLFESLFPVLRSTKSEHPTDIFFLEAIPVTPPRYRPVDFTNGTIKENGRSMVLKKIIQDAEILKAMVVAYNQSSVETLSAEVQKMVNMLQGSTILAKLHFAWEELQQSVNQIVDTNAQKDAVGVGFKQVIEKKEGLFRMHMMGKRVNFSARTVITPDPNLKMEEIGIPDVFAKKLTFPTPVTTYNFYAMRELVKRGPNVHPGALAVAEENGRIISLAGMDQAERDSVAISLCSPSEAAIGSIKSRNGGEKHKTLFKPKIVYRHLHDGDLLLMNRQPTLHKPSIMGFQARVLYGEKTMRMHYANCKSFNADFDGDEMNAHFPQNEVARAEGYNIVGVQHQYLVPKDGTPLSGLIQDSMVSGVRLSVRGQFFNRADYQQLVLAGLVKCNGKTILLPPTILKPVALWSGKQILSTIILNLTPKGEPKINMTSKAKISIKDWQVVPARPWRYGGTPLKGNAMTESEVVIRKGELLVGVLDKMHYGATSYGLVHAFNELYGGKYSCQLLTSFSRCFNAQLQMKGFTLGVHDIVVKAKAEKKRRKIISRIKTMGDEIAARGVGIDPANPSEFRIENIQKLWQQAHNSRSELKRMTVDRAYKGETDKITNEVNKTCIPGGLVRKFPDNNLSLMIQAGAKGSSVNFMQISCCLGQIELEGKRPPMMISGRSLPSFLPYDTSPRAGGFISGRFLTGIRPQEFFFHCMAGREGLIDTAVKTANSGYLQRCLVKHLEGLTVAYDGTVRDSDGSMIQFAYGEDGLDICKSQYLNKSGISFLLENSECIRSLNPRETGNETDVKSAQKAVKKWAKKHDKTSRRDRTGGFLYFSSVYKVDMDRKGFVNRSRGQDSRTWETDELQKIWSRMTPEERKPYYKKQGRAPDPVISQFNACNNVDVLNEKLGSLVDDFAKEPSVEMGRKELTRLIYSKSMAAAVAPGEAVGMLAAQSIGEPSTQMTLNTFHFAGRGDMNVTLGIPRLKEILTIASVNIKTPQMTIPLFAKGSVGNKQAEKLVLKLTRVTLADVMEKFTVTETMSVAGDRRARIYDLRFAFLPRFCYKDRYCVKPKMVLHYFETRFVQNILLPGMRKEAAAQSEQTLFVTKSVAVTRSRAKGGDGDDGNDDGKADDAPVNAGGGGDESDDGDEEDARATRIKEQNTDTRDYDDEEESEKKKNAALVYADDAVDEGIQEDEKDDEENEEDDEAVQLNETSVVEDAPVEDEITAEMEDSIETRKRNMCHQDDWIVDYEFDFKESLHCRLELSVPLTTKKVDMSSAIRRWAESAVVHQVPQIRRAIVDPAKTEEEDVFIKTEGVNIGAMCEHSKILNLNRLYCNNIHSVYNQYGIEAASTVIVNEVRNVFKVYGITVDPRHLSLVADYMTSGGSYRPFNRVGMNDSTSAMQQISFETATEFLKNASLQGKVEKMTSPSSRLILGMPVQLTCYAAYAVPFGYVLVLRFQQGI
uniref:DNA-directed RNA polymerase subunit n=1 Tax=Evadne anonyx TaxID=141404 RepID=A0A9N6WRD9_9CRUS|nr:EOG090X00BV [Evadne anonyx]